LGLAAYEKGRQDFRRRIIELKQKRRVSLGDRVSLVFENRETVIFQIQEMLRVERITDLDKIREEIATYNQLIPDSRELSATMFLEIENQTHLRDQLLKFLGIEEAIRFNIGRHSVPIRFEAGRSRETKSARCNIFDSISMIRRCKRSSAVKQASLSSTIKTIKRPLCCHLKPRGRSPRI
jgi:hypothetical protein